MKIVIVHNEVGDGAGPDVQDVLVQADSMAQALQGLGHQVERLACSLNLEELRSQLLTAQPDLLVNLVEDLAGHGRLIHLAPFLFDALGLPYTGNKAEAILLTSHKTMAKEAMLAASLPTPDWLGPWPGCRLEQASRLCGRQKRWIVKSLWEDASLGLDANCLVSGSAEEVFAVMAQRAMGLGGACFAEEYIDGREFNLALLQDGDGVQVLSPAEILFEGFGEDQPRIVDYQAKWQEDSFNYHHTPRTFDFSAADQALLARLQAQACRAWQAFRLSGYARVDFRVAADGRPFILEINANPCLSPDAGFMAAATQSGLDMAKVMTRLIESARPTEA